MPARHNPSDWSKEKPFEGLCGDPSQFRFPPSDIQLMFHLLLYRPCSTGKWFISSGTDCPFITPTSALWPNLPARKYSMQRRSSQTGTLLRTRFFFHVKSEERPSASGKKNRVQHVDHRSLWNVMSGKSGSNSSARHDKHEGSIARYWYLGKRRHCVRKCKEA